MFRAIASEDFPPFGEFRLELPAVQDKPDDIAEVHLFTGVNGTGKTRVLSVLSAFLGSPEHLQRRIKGNDIVSLSATDSFLGFADTGQWTHMSAAGAGIGSGKPGGSFQKWLLSTPAFAYSGYAYLRDSPVTALGPVAPPTRQMCLSFNRPEGSSDVLLQAITNLLLESAVDSLNYASGGTGAGRAARLVDSIQNVLFEVTGTKFQFRFERFPSIALYAVWGGNKLPFDVLPDGLRAILGWLVHALVMMDVWQQGKGEPATTEAVFLLDEIESHLHPAWQRKILPAFQRLFPKSQIFVATHSPFVIASLNHGWIHSLKVDQNGNVKNEKPRAAGKGDSYITVVEDIMGLKEWFDPETENLLAEFRRKRDAAYDPIISEAERARARENARQLALQIGQRSIELDFMMGKELNQMERQLARVAVKA
jgi:hypothetical protein